MTPAQADGGFVELDLPDGGRVLVSFGDDLATDADVEASVVLMMLAVSGDATDVRAALADYAQASGWTARTSTAGGAVTVRIG